MNGSVRVGVVGLGLIGGGIALDLVRGGRSVVGFDLDADVRHRASELGVPTVPDLHRLLADVDVVVVAVPLAAVSGTIAEARSSDPDVLLTDVASVKDPAVLGAERTGRFIGGHPMGGSERSGIDAARPGMFDGVAWFLTPDEHTLVGDLVTVVELVRGLAADPILVRADTHDRYVAVLSHVPHLVAFALNATATDEVGAGLHGLGGGSFRDTTRVASSDPAFWADVLHANRRGITDALALLSSWLGDTTSALGDRDRLLRRLAAARRRPVSGPADDAVSVVLPGADEPLGPIVQRLHALGAQGYGVSEVAMSDEGVRLGFRWR